VKLWGTARAARLGAATAQMNAYLTTGELRQLVGLVGARVGVAGAPFAERLGEDSLRGAGATAGNSRVVMEGRQHRGLCDGGDHAVFQRRGGGKPELLAVQAPLAEELTGLKNPADRLLALLGHNDNFDAALLDVEDLVRRVSLQEDGLVLAESRHGLSFAVLSEEGLRVKLIHYGLCQRSSPG